jgi:hypothetical protein
MSETKDCHNAPVVVGMKVRVLKVRPSIVAKLPPTDQERVLSMQGEVLEVYEIDEWGSAWVKQWWPQGGGRALSHSIGLSPGEMEIA